MNILLYLPGLLVILVKTRGILGMLYHLAVIFAVQVLLAIPFLQHHPKAYITNAFEFSRIFLYKWTVNWRFVPEDVFLSKQFTLLLLGLHLTVLVAFGLCRWCEQDGGSIRVIKRALVAPGRPAALARVGSSGMYRFLSELHR